MGGCLDFPEKGKQRFCEWTVGKWRWEHEQSGWKGMEERVLKETNRKGGITGSGTNLVQGTLPVTYKDDP